MNVATFSKEELKKLYIPPANSKGEDNGQLTIIGGSSLFHGAPLLSVKVASRMVDMVFFSSPEPSVGEVAAKFKSSLLSFIWVPWDEVEDYVQKSDAVLIGPGFMRFGSEKAPHGQRTHICDEVCMQTRTITQKFLEKFSDKRWVIDAGSLQTMLPEWLPDQAIVTPNQKEYALLFGDISPQKAAEKYNCIIVQKGEITLVTSAKEQKQVHGGNAGLTKGGTGDVQAGLTAALLAKNDPFLAATAGAYLTKAAADALYEKVGTQFNADDVANEIPLHFFRIMRDN